MTGRHLPLLVAILLITASTLFAAPRPPRPLAGIGVLSMPPSEGVTIPLHREPGLGRSGELAVGSAPPPDPLFPVTGETLLRVIARQGEWLSVLVDDAERTGWVRRRTGWRFIPWEEFLVGREAILLPGLSPSLSTVTANGTPPRVTNLPAGTRFRIAAVDDGRAFVIFPDATSGWLQWRDREGRLTISLPPRP